MVEPPPPCCCCCLEEGEERALAATWVESKSRHMEPVPPLTSMISNRAFIKTFLAANGIIGADLCEMQRGGTVVRTIHPSSSSVIVVIAVVINVVEERIFFLLFGGPQLRFEKIVITVVIPSVSLEHTSSLQEGYGVHAGNVERVSFLRNVLEGKEVVLVQQLDRYSTETGEEAGPDGETDV